MLIIDIVMAIWYGIRARQLGRRWYGWAVLGFFVPDVTFLVAVEVLARVFGGGTMELTEEAAAVIVLGGMLTSVLVGIIVGRKVLKPRVQRLAAQFLDCPFCGIRNLATAGNCTVCGARLGDDESSWREEITTASKPERPRSAGKEDKRL